LFFKDNGPPIRVLGYFHNCSRKSSDRLGLRYRRPYCARHSSVSWNLMVGKSPLFVSRQHGHSVTTMWRTYAAWMDDALDSDVVLIQAAMYRVDPATERVSNTQMDAGNAAAVTRFGTRLATRWWARGPSV
jgi:flavorubredoxin